MAISQLEVKQYMLKNKVYFEKEEISCFERIISKSNITLEELQTFKFKSPNTAILLSILFGIFGVDRFYSGNYIMGIIKLITMGGCCFWWIIDCFLIGRAIKEDNQSRLYSFLKSK